MSTAFSIAQNAPPLTFFATPLALPASLETFRRAFQFTFSVTVVLRLKPPEVPVMVSVKVPAGVPLGARGAGAAPPPPPQPTQTRTRSNETPSANRVRCLGFTAKLAAAKTSRHANHGSAPGGHLPGEGGAWGARGRTNVLAVVVTVALAVAGLVPSDVTELGETEQVAAVGAPVQLKETACLNPLVGETARSNVVDWPAEIAAVLGEAVNEKSEISTVSESEADCEPLIPRTVKTRKLVVKTFRLLTVSVLVWPGVIAAGLKEQLAGELAEQERLIEPVKAN